ncbi:hypothetical protein [Candidatus Poriferisodalis sp.]|uniref:hypothetical protein n=1 Tax=Candidatus Poriferisodalis sp. TaxID=3101277 RepID=UPI003B02D2C5
MGWFRRRRNLRLRPLSELHDEFAARPGAQSMLDDAEAELAEREHTPHAQQRL